MAHEIEHQNSEKLVLLVEDDVDIGEVLLEVITQETPYQALLKTDGQEALAAVQSQKPDLFILDYHLPRMTGIELYDRLHAIDELACVPALMISARLPLQELRKRNIVGMNKPIDLDDFLQAIERFLE
ncbi:MAG TPA: response regulator [Ktedonobacteraceae bacterium]|jgi:CheY-like chemotaxis protein